MPRAVNVGVSFVGPRGGQRPNFGSGLPRQNRPSFMHDARARVTHREIQLRGSHEHRSNGQFHRLRRPTSC